jgi:hypothetical protein
MRKALIIAFACFPALALAQKPDPVVSHKTKQATGTIQAVSQSDRHVVVQMEGGSPIVLEAGDAVRNFDQVRPGDRVVVSYQEGWIAEVKPPGEGKHDVATASARAPEGERPGAVAGKTITTTVKVRSVDPSLNAVTFERPDGVVRKLSVADPKAQEFIRKLNPGDEVQVTYAEATAVSIQPAKG